MWVLCQEFTNESGKFEFTHRLHKPGLPRATQAWASLIHLDYHSCDQFAKLNKSALKCRETDIRVLPC